MADETYISNVQQAREAILDKKIPVEAPYDDETLEWLVGKRVVVPVNNVRELRPKEQCPHCSSYQYRAMWRRSSPRTRDAWWRCERCGYQKPFEIPPDDEDDSTRSEVHNPKDREVEVRVNGELIVIPANSTVEL